jgi:UDP-N-acetylmuramate: L-alanyl-gamma-D-glutamyl-meso-diaminopimelate ligase
VDKQPGGIMRWDLIGQHNAHNILAVAAAAGHLGLTAGEVCEAMASFKSVKRRLQLLAVINDITIYDDFAHHPTEIRATLQALRQKVGDKRIIAIMEPRSNTMRMGVHGKALADSFNTADQILFYQPDNISWDLKQQTFSLGKKREIFNNIENIVENTVKMAKPGDNIVFMSNGGFGGIQEKLIKRIQALV